MSEMKGKKISLIVPVYRHPELVKRAVLSALEQTWENVEILLIDDGSPDGCDLICDEVAQMDPRVRVFHTENKGVSSARNLGLRSATGEYIAFLDSDDFLEPDHLETLFLLIDHHKADLASTSMIIEKDANRMRFVDDNEIINFSREEAILSMHREGKFNGYLMNKLFSVEVLDGVFFDSSIFVHEDMLFLWEAILRSEKIVYQHKHTYHYLIHPESAMNRAFSPRFETCIDAASQMVKKMQIHFPKHVALSHKTLLFSMLSVANKRAFSNSLDAESYKRLRAIQKEYHSREAFSEIVGLENRISYRVFSYSRSLFIFWKRILPGLKELREKLK